MGYLQLVIMALIALSLSVAGPFILYKLSKSPVAVVILFMVAIVIDALTVQPVALRLGLNLYPLDLCCLAAIPCVVLNLIRRSVLYLFLPATLLLMILTIGLFRGLSTYGTTAGVDYRQFIYCLTAWTLLSTSGLTAANLLTIRRAWIGAAILLTLIAFQRWATDLFDLPIPHYWQGVGATNTIRVLGSADALMIAMAAVAVLAGSGAKPGARAIVLGNLLLVVVIVLQHRSVWIATIVGLGMLAILAKRARPMLLKQALALAIVVPFAIGGSLALGVDMTPLTESLTESADSAIKGEGTVIARETSWQGLLAGYLRADPIDQAIGAPMGSGYERFTGGVYDPRVQFQPHDLYLQILLRGGVLGLVLLVAALGLAAVRSIRTARRSGAPIPQWLAAAVWMSLAYFIPYGASIGAGIVLGLAQARVDPEDGVAGLWRSRRKRPPQPVAGMAQGL